MWIAFLLAGVAAAVYLVSLYKSGFTVNRDDFRKTAWVHSNNKAGSSALGMQYWLRALYVEGGLARIQLYCSSREKDWRFYKSATGEDSTELEFISVDTDVGDANVKIGGSVDTIEKFALNIPVEYLRKMAGKDWEIKVYGKRGQEVLKVRQKASTQFLGAIDRIERDPGALTDGSISGPGLGKVLLVAIGFLIAILVLLVALGSRHSSQEITGSAPPEPVESAKAAATTEAIDPAPGRNEPKTGLPEASNAEKYLGAIVIESELPDGLQSNAGFTPVLENNLPVAYVTSVFNDKETMLWVLVKQESHFKITKVVHVKTGPHKVLVTPGDCSYPKPTQPYVFFALVSEPEDVNELVMTQFLTDIEQAWTVDKVNGELSFVELPIKGIVCNNSSYGT